MAETYINTKKIGTLAGEQSRISSELLRISEQIESLSGKIYLKSDGKSVIEKSLIEITKQIKSEATRVSTSSEKLLQIATLYEQAESNIVGNGGNKSGDDKFLQSDNDYDNNTKTFDDDKSNGTYGGDQGNMAHHKKGIWFFGFRWFEDEDLYDFIRQHDRYKDYSQTEIAELLDQINEEGCGFVSMVNNIYTEFEGHEDEFEKTFGFPMYDKDGKANYDYLLVDIYANTNDMFFLDDPKGETALVNAVINSYSDEEFRERYGCDPSIDGNINPEAKQAILDEYSGQDVVEYKSEGNTSYSVVNSMTHYLNEKGISCDASAEFGLTVDQVNSYLDDGKNVNIGVSDFNMYDESGKMKYEDVGGHSMSITGVTDDGRYIVSSWGKKYYLDPSELSDASYVISDITDITVEE